MAKELKAINIIDAAKRTGSLKEEFLEHKATYGIDKIEELFPNHKNLNREPGFLDNNIEWVNAVLKNVTTQPFSRVRSSYTDMTPDTLKAKGYAKGKKKIEDVMTVLARTTDPTTIYKKQKLDRDDIIDITDFEVVGWIKKSMRLKLDETLARAILIGDGRLSSDQYKIDETCIRPIVNDDDLYSIKASYKTGDNNVKDFINTCIRSRKQYKGSGNITLFTTEDMIADILLLENNNGDRIYRSIEEIKSLLRVSNIVTMEDMQDLVSRVEEVQVEETTYNDTYTVRGILVNLVDYTVGADKGGRVSMFEDFDIDFNQMKYLIETRCSGALTKPYSAIVVEEVTRSQASLPANLYDEEDQYLDE